MSEPSVVKERATATTLSIPVYPPPHPLTPPGGVTRVPLAAAAGLIAWLLARTTFDAALDPLPASVLALVAAWALEGRTSRLTTAGLALLAETLYLTLPPVPLRGAGLAWHALLAVTLGASAALVGRRLARDRYLRGKSVPEEVQARLDTIFEASGEGIALLDAHGLVRHASRSTPRILGVGLADWVGTPLGSRVHPHDAPTVDATFDRALAHPGQPFAVDLRLRGRDDTFRHFSGVLTNELRDANVQAVIFNFRDVSARLGVEQALRASEERYRALIEKSVAGFYLTDRDGRFVACNPALARMLGCAEPGDLVGRLDAELYVDPDVRRRGGARLLRQGSLSGFEIDLRRRDGETRRFLGSANVVRTAAGQELIEGTLIDVTERARAEERARLLDRMKRNFMIVASHEMRTPLTVVRGYLDLMLEDARGRDDPHRQFLEVSQSNLERLTTIVSNITDVLAIEDNRLTISPADIDLTRLAREVIAEVESFARARGLTIELEAPERAPWQADPEKLRAALQQLLENAIKFTPDGGHIGVRLAPTAAGVDLVVTDSGVGIEAWELEHIFEKFYAGAEPMHHSSGRFKFGARGPGLGLAIAKGYVEAHGGTLRAHSDGRGRGATFHLELPASARDGEA